MPFQRLQKFHWFQKKRFGLSVLNHMITSNHLHLLIRDTGPNVIADSMQLIAGPYRQDHRWLDQRSRSFLNHDSTEIGS